MTVYDLYIESDFIHLLDSEYLKLFLKSFIGIDKSPRDYLNENFDSCYRKSHEQFFHEFLNSNPEKNFVRISFKEKIDIKDIKNYLSKFSKIIGYSYNLLTTEWLFGENKYDYVLVQFTLPCRRQTFINEVVNKIKNESKKVKKLSKNYRVENFSFFGEESLNDKI